MDARDDDGDQNNAWVVWVASIGGVLAVIALLFVLSEHSTVGFFLAVLVSLFVVRWILQGRRYRGNERLDGKVVIITGCNTGIGKAHALDLAQRGARVYMACRDFQRCEDARLEIVRKSGNANVINIQLDLGSLASIREFVQKFLAVENRLDILVNNAGVMPSSRQTTSDGMEMQMGVNHMGPFLLTNLLLDVLRRSAPSRVVVLSSSGHYSGKINRDDLHSERTGYSMWYTYCNTKLANVLFVRSLSKRLEGSGVTVNALHPGAVRTDIGRDLNWINVLLFPVKMLFFRTPEAGSQTQIRLSVDPSLEKVSGRFYADCREKRPADLALDDELAEWLWTESAKATGLN